MNHLKSSLLAACGLALVAAPVAFAGDDADSKFKMMDTNSDGRISLQEHKQGFEQKFATLDANRDGTLSAAEIEAKADLKKDGDWKKDKKHGGTDHLRMADTNSDGLLTKAEHDAACQTSFSDADSNADGFLTQSEFNSSHKKMKKDK